MMSSTIQYKAHEGDRDAVESSLNLLKTMRDDGNMPAHDYYKQLVQLKCDLDHAAQQMSGNFIGSVSNGDRDSIHQSPQEASGNLGGLGFEARGTVAGLQLGEGLSFDPLKDLDMGAVLEVSAIQDFITQQLDETWAADDYASFYPTGFNGQEDCNVWDSGLLGTF
jgi:hypothetical protein